MMWRRVVAGLAKHRVLATNSFVFGSLSGLAELSQQGLLRRLGSEDQKKKPINWSAVGRYVFVGGLVFSPVLTVWYRWLDGRMPGTGARGVAKKVAVDALVLDVPLYTVFYMTMNGLEGKSFSQGFEEVKSKLAPTVVFSILLWVPAQAFNFMFLPPKMRVVYIAIVTFLEMNVLALMKRIPLRDDE